MLDTIYKKSREEREATGQYLWEDYNKQREIMSTQSKLEKTEMAEQGIYHRMEMQFEIGIRMTHSFKSSISRVCSFCSQKRYPQPTRNQLIHMTQIYWTTEELFTKGQFENALTAAL